MPTYILRYWDFETGSYENLYTSMLDDIHNFMNKRAEKGSMYKITHYGIYTISEQGE